MEGKIEKTVNLGYKVRRMREVVGLTQRDLANRLHMYQIDIFRMEKKKQMATEMLEKIAEALEVTPEQILRMEQQHITDFIKGL